MSKKRGRTGPTVNEMMFNDGSNNSQTQNDDDIVAAAKKRGYSVEYSDGVVSDRPGAVLMNLNLKELTIVALIFVLFIKMSIIPALNVFMSGYAEDSKHSSISTTSSNLNSNLNSVSQTHSTLKARTCRSVGDTSNFHGADIILLGGGGVAQEIMLQLAASTHLRTSTNGGELNVAAVFDTSGGVSTSVQVPMTPKALRTIVRTKRAGGAVLDVLNTGKKESVFTRATKQINLQSMIHAMTAPTSSTSSASLLYSSTPCTSLLIVIDATSDASEKHAETISQMLSTFTCTRLILANKAPISSVTHEDVAEIAFRPISSSSLRQIYYEATVGAALPIIKTVQELNDVGDAVVKIEALLSGSASYILSDMMQNQQEKEMNKDNDDENNENNKNNIKKNNNSAENPMIQATKKAMALGFTESNPCIDLSGVDVVRKGLILGRLMSEDGSVMSMEDVDVTPLSNACQMNTGDKGMLIIKDSKIIEKKISESLQKKEILRYVTTIESYGTANSKRIKVQVGLKSYGLEHPFGRSVGNVVSPENILIVHTALYNEYPFILSGPGAGSALTASAVMGDLLKCVAAK